MTVTVAYAFTRVVTIPNANDHFEALDAALGQFIFADKMQTPTVEANPSGGFDVSCPSTHSVTFDKMSQRAAVSSFLSDGNLPDVVDLSKIVVS